MRGACTGAYSHAVPSLHTTGAARARAPPSYPASCIPLVSLLMTSRCSLCLGHPPMQGLMRKRIASINEAPIQPEERRIAVPPGQQPRRNSWLAEQARQRGRTQGAGWSRGLRGLPPAGRACGSLCLRGRATPAADACRKLPPLCSTAACPPAVVSCRRRVWAAQSSRLAAAACQPTERSAAGMFAAR